VGNAQYAMPYMLEKQSSLDFEHESFLSLLGMQKRWMDNHKIAVMGPSLCWKAA